MSDAFVYMFVVASGAASGVAVVAFISFKFFAWTQKSRKVQPKRRGIV